MSRPEEDAPSVDDVHFDKTKLEASASAERGDLFLLNWLSGCEKALEKLPEVSLVPHELCGGKREQEKVGL